MAWFYSFLSIYTWGQIALMALSGFLIQLLLFALTCWWDPQKRICGRFFRLVGASVVKLSPLWTFRLVGNVPKHIPGKTVVVSNHVSHMDIFLLAQLPWEMKWLAKASLFKIPVFGWMLRLAGDIPVVRGQGNSIAKAMQHCQQYLENNMPVCIFPEGTRSPTADLLPFKDGAFNLAIDTGAAIFPVAVYGTRDALPKYSWRFGKAHGYAKVGTPITTTGMSKNNTNELKHLARQQIETMLKELALISQQKKY